MGFRARLRNFNEIFKMPLMTGRFYATPDKVRAELKGSGGTILQTSLTHEEEAKLQAALDATGPAGSL